MVHFEKDKIILEIPVGDPFYEYLQMLNALMVLGWYVSERTEDESVGKAFGILAFYFGKSLSDMEYDQKTGIDSFLRKPDGVVEELPCATNEQD